MGKFAACVLVLVAACQPMYAGSSERLKSPAKVPHKEVVEPIAAIPYVEDCRTNFRGDPTGLKVDPARSDQFVGNGDDSIAQSDKLPDPVSQAKAVVNGIENYSKALVTDPYNADATLKLALAYDRVYRKGCALKLLARIATLESHPKFRSRARRVVDQVSDSPEWFKGYRQEAIAAIGGMTPSAPPARP